MAALNKCSISLSTDDNEHDTGQNYGYFGQVFQFH